MRAPPTYRLPDLEYLRGGSPIRQGFLWGVANAAFQVEGGINAPGGPENNWSHLERSGSIEPAGEAVRFWSDWPRHLDLAAAMGLGAFRLSVEWARLQRGPGAELDHEVLTHYTDVVAGCRERGLEPVVTLHHFTHPAWLGPDAWVDQSWPDAYSRYAVAVATGLNEDLEGRGVEPVRWWITVNEPNIFSFGTALSGELPRGPLTRGPRAFRRMLDSLLTGHVHAYRGIHRAHADRGWSAPMVTFNTYCTTLYPFDRGLLDLALARERATNRRDLGADLATMRPRFDDELRPLHGLASELADGVLERLLLPDLAANLPRYVAALYEGEGPAFDFVGIDYYVGPLAHYLRWPAGARRRGRSAPIIAAFWETTIRPDGLRMFVLANHRRESPMPILVVENGMATRVRDGRSQARPDGWTRPAFVRAHVAEILEAARRGAPVGGYLHWTLTDNYEWGSYEPAFGIHGVDRRGGDIRILPTDTQGLDSAGAYGAIVRSLRENDTERALAEITRST